MRVLALPCIALLLAVSATSRADMLIGLAAANELAGVNIEFVGEGSSFYAVLGSYQSNTGYELDDLTAVVGYRRFQGGQALQSGYFGGAFAGDIDGGPGYNRFGAGGEVGYQWMTDHLRMSLQAGVGLVGESSRGPKAGSTDVEPVAVIGAGINLRF